MTPCIFDAGRVDPCRRFPLTARELRLRYELERCDRELADLRVTRADVSASRTRRLLGDVLGQRSNF